ncbi:amidase [Rhodococcus sp. NPDC058521]|uniref:amidase n=1 Tax=Rhodococcus sp. NPDC058521 TaxID=3346536 RepID=UPI00365C54A6
MTRLTAVEIAREVRSGELSSSAATDASLDTITHRDPELRAFVRVRDQARVDARALAARADLANLPLAGVPVAIKDNVAVAGLPETDGSRATSKEPRTSDHPVVSRLRAAGAIVVGMTAVPELCVFGSTDSPGSITRNPWNSTLTPGGSSGGSAAAVAAGMVPLAVGNDGMGSIRIPSAACGVFGVKPGRGVVPSELGVDSWFGMSENGPIATTVADAALMLSVMADRPELAVPGDVESLRVAVAVGSPTPLASVDDQWRATTERVAALLSGAGHRTFAAEIPYPKNLLPLVARWTAGAASDAAALDAGLLQPRTRRHTAIGRRLRRFVDPKQVSDLEETLSRFFENADVVITPSLARPPVPAVAWSEKSWLSNVVSNLRYAPFSALWNMAGWPAASVPVGLHLGSGTPMAVQIAAPPGSEAKILGLAARIEQLEGWTRVAPTT